MFVDTSDSATIQAAVDTGVSTCVVDGLKKEPPTIDVTIARFHAFRRLRERAFDHRKRIELPLAAKSPGPTFETWPSASSIPHRCWPACRPPPHSATHYQGGCRRRGGRRKKRQASFLGGRCYFADHLSAHRAALLAGRRPDGAIILGLPRIARFLLTLFRRRCCCHGGPERRPWRRHRPGRSRTDAAESDRASSSPTATEHTDG